MSDPHPNAGHTSNDASDGLSNSWVSALAAAVGLLAVSLVSLAARPAESLLAHPVIEDAYYALSVARNIAQGRGITIDGETLTSGFQPLFTLVEAVPFLGSTSTVTSLRLVSLLQVVVLLAAGTLLALIVRDHLGLAGTRGRIAILGALTIFVASFFTINSALNGLETGALFLAYAGSWRYFQTRGAGGFVEAILLGLLLGLTVLVRVDAAVVVICVIAMVLLAEGLRRAAIVAFTSAVVAAPWFAYNLVQFGSVVPSGGSAQTDVDPSWFRIWQMIEAWSAALMPWLPLSRFSSSGAVIVRVLLIVLIVALLARTRAFLPQSVIQRRTWLFAGAMIAGYGLLAGYYTTTSYAVWFYGRYMAPLVLVASFAVALLVLRRITRARIALLIGLAAVGCMAALLHWSPTFYPRNEMLDDQVALVKAVVPDGVVVAAGQTGTLGFFRDHVVNLDGKVNPEALANAEDIRGYLDQEGIDWVCDWPSLLDKYLGTGRPGWAEVERRGEFVCMSRLPAG